MAAVGKHGWRRLLLAMAAGALVLATACRGNRDSEDSVKLSTQELVDLIPHYYPPHDPEKWAAPDTRVYYDYILSTPQYQAWAAKRKEGHAALREWFEFLDRLQAELGDEYHVRDGTAPSDFSFHALVYRTDAPRPAHGLILSNLVLRRSMLAPVYDMYESRTRIAMVGPKQDDLVNRDERQLYDISREFARAADVLARAVEAEYGCQRLWPDVLRIRILHLQVDDQLVNQANLGHAFLGEYHW